MTNNHQRNLPNEDAAERLAELGIKRERTRADIDDLHASVRSVRRAIEHFAEQQHEQHAHYTSHLNEASGDERLALLDDWQTALNLRSRELLDLLAELERHQTQEQILLQMLVEIDNRMEELSSAFEN